MKRLLSSCSALALLFVPACGGDKPTTPAKSPAETAPSSTPAKTQSPAVKKPSPPVRLDMVLVKALWGNEPGAPDVDNPATPEKVALGRMLFHDKGLSKDGAQNCASCHDLANYGQDGKNVEPGLGGKFARNTPPVWNASRQFAQLWDYSVTTVEALAQAPHSHGMADEATVLANLGKKPEVVAAFAKAFPGAEPMTAKNLAFALGAFQRTLVTTSRFDKFLDGDSRALSNEEKLGLKAFMDVGCQTCHMSRLVGGSMQQKLGVYSSYPDPEDTGRAAVSGNEIEKYFFKVPSLLNVEKTAPYNHDGAKMSLEEVVKEMGDIQLQKKLTDEQVDSIVAFLKTLTGELPAEIVAPK